MTRFIICGWMLLVLAACDSSPMAPGEGAPATPAPATPAPVAPTGSTEPLRLPPPGPGSADSFDIQLVFIPGHRLTSTQVQIVEDAARRWEKVIIGDIPDIDYSAVPFDSEKSINWGAARHDNKVIIDVVVDDLCVLVTTNPDPEGYFALGGVVEYRADSGFPVISRIVIEESQVLETATDKMFETTVLHELGHTLGFGTSWEEDLLMEPSWDNLPDTDTHFSGPLAVQAFDAAGGDSYPGKKVPVSGEGDDGHWRPSVFGNELMVYDVDLNLPAPLSAITIQSLADLGYEVDVSQADPYTLPVTW